MAYIYSDTIDKIFSCYFALKQRFSCVLKMYFNFSRQISLVNRSDIFVIFSFLLLVLIYYQLLRCLRLAFKTTPRHVDESSYKGQNHSFFNKIVISIYNTLGLNVIKEVKNISLLISKRERYLQNCKFLFFSYIFKNKYKRSQTYYL